MALTSAAAIPRDCRSIVRIPQHCFLPLLGPRPPGDFPTRREPSHLSWFAPNVLLASDSYLPEAPLANCDLCGAGIARLVLPLQFPRPEGGSHRAQSHDLLAAFPHSGVRMSAGREVDAQGERRCFLGTTCAEDAVIAGSARPTRGAELAPRPVPAGRSAAQAVPPDLRVARVVVSGASPCRPRGGRPRPRRSTRC